MLIRSEKEINKIIQNVKATMNIEGIEMPLVSEQLGRKVLKGEITAEQAVKLIKDRYIN
ncbi:antitoxin VbhA family protein [Clostridium sp. KNHs214]|uniref:antitoxin VbhA family protein n=1 Tax=Clostridium sp. KNHs214 TaxID=1540257 RepID=UPI000A46EABB|nr:antitoxin VbhA family protein [Clostridium sp. KNHs214]